MTDEGPSERLVFADTSGLIARFVECDSAHPAAEREVRRLLAEGRIFLTTNFVFDEVVTRVRRLGGYRLSRTVGEALLRSGSIRRLYLDQEWEGRAWALYEKYRDHELSFTDATSMAVMRALSIGEVLTFDSDFERAGFTMLPRRPRR